MKHRVSSTGIICDQTVALQGYQTSQNYPDRMRRIRMRDPLSGKTLVFLTNNFELPATVIRALYKRHWRVLTGQ
jgi:hypothetical protein